MTEGERLAFVIDKLCGGNQALFARTTGIGNTVINKIIHGTGKSDHITLTKNYILRICKAFPEINPDFLAGRDTYPGPLDKDAVRALYEAKMAEKDHLIADLQLELAFQRKLLERLLEKDES